MILSLFFSFSFCRLSPRNCFVKIGFISFCIIPFRFGQFHFDLFRFASISFRFGKFRFVSVNFVSFGFISFRFGIFRFAFRFAFHRYPTIGRSKKAYHWWDSNIGRPTIGWI